MDYVVICTLDSDGRKYRVRDGGGEVIYADLDGAVAWAMELQDAFSTHSRAAYTVMTAEAARTAGID